MIEEKISKKRFNIKLVYIPIFGVFVIFLIHFILHPAEIAPAFLSNIIPLYILDVVIFPVTLFPPIIFAFFAVNIVRNVIKKSNDESIDDIFRQHFPIKGAICFIGSIFLIIVLCNLMELSVRDKVKDYLNKVSTDATVIVNEQSFRYPNKVISELKKVAPMAGHGSHATKRVVIEVVSGNETLILELGRDSSNDQEYWVFYPKYRYTSSNEFGRIITDIFDDY